MTADQNVDDSLNGVEAGTGGDDGGSGANTALSWRPVYVRARTVIATTLNKIPFNWPNTASPSTTSTYDQVQGAAEQTAWRYVDSFGQVWDNVKLSLVLVEWLMDGAPTPMTPAQLNTYVQNASTLRSWPTGFPGAFPGDPQETYPVWPPVAPTPVTPTPAA
jgi:hypothetical protein